MRNWKLKIAAFFLAIFCATNFVLAEDEKGDDSDSNSDSTETETTSDSAARVNTSTVFEMPKMQSDTPVEVYSPVRFHTEENSVPRPFSQINYSEKFSIYFSKNTKIRDKNGAIISVEFEDDDGETETGGVKISPPRKTLAKNVPRPSKKLLAPYLATFGNPCVEADKTCDEPTIYFSPPAIVKLPLPNETFKEGNFEMHFFDDAKWAWEKIDSSVETSAKKVRVEVAKAGLLAFVSRTSSARLSQQINSDEMLLVVPPAIRGKDFKLQHFSAASNAWKNLEFTVDAVENSILKIKKPSGDFVFSFVAETVENNCPSNLSASILNSNSAENVATPEEKFFADVQSDDWFFDAIKFLIEKKVFEKDPERNFSPRKIVNRAEAATILSAAFALPEKEFDFADVQSDDWFSAVANKTVGNGVFAPLLGKKFKSTRGVSRAEAVAAALRAGRVKISDSENPNFTDIPTDFKLAKEIFFAAENEIVSAAKTEFSPRETVTKAEFAKIVAAVARFVDSVAAINLNVEFGAVLPEEIFLENSEKNPFETDFLNWESGPDIFRLKKFLAILGFFTGDFDENFDEDLEAALLKFQLEKGIVENEKTFGAGRLGRSTRAKLNEILSEL